MGFAMLNPSYDSLPLTEAEFAALMDAVGGFEARPRVAIAVSGGPDSMALMLLADRWARQSGGEAWGLTVDHGLRPESAAEAGIVAGWLAGRGIRHETLLWEDEKPTGGIQEAARDARYRLLSEWCRAHACLHLLTAHHREDQAETHLIRRRAGSGIDGLAGMSAVRELPHCRLARPLLAVPRARLAALLAAEGQPFLQDPSNLDPAFERARLRLPPTVIPGRPGGPNPESRNTERARLNRPVFLDSGLTAARRPGMTDEVIAATLDFGRQRIARERDLDSLIARAVGVHPAGLAMLDPAALAAADAERGERLLGRVAACIGAARYPARRDRLARLFAGLRADPKRARTLGGCRFVPWRGRILVLRELAAASSPVWLGPGSAIRCDRRFAAALAPTAASGFMLGCLGQSGASAPEDCDGDLPRLAHAVLPALWDEQGLAAIPHLGYRRAVIGELPVLSFRPANPLTRAGFTVV